MHSRLIDTDTIEGGVKKMCRLIKVSTADRVTNIYKHGQKNRFQLFEADASKLQEQFQGLKGDDPKLPVLNQALAWLLFGSL